MLSIIFIVKNPNMNGDFYKIQIRKKVQNLCFFKLQTVKCKCEINGTNKKAISSQKRQQSLSPLSHTE